MRHFTRMAGFVGVVALTSACYNARVETGLEPSEQVVKEAWAPSWIFGAVSPPVVETAAACPGGVAMVHTYHSFLNMLVAGLTGGIFTPMSIEVTCARAAVPRSVAGTPEVRIERDASAARRLQALQEAVDRARRTGEYVVVRFEG